MGRGRACFVLVGLMSSSSITKVVGVCLQVHTPVVGCPPPAPSLLHLPLPMLPPPPAPAEHDPGAIDIVPGSSSSAAHSLASICRKVTGTADEMAPGAETETQTETQTETGIDADRDSKPDGLEPGEYRLPDHLQHLRPAHTGSTYKIEIPLPALPSLPYPAHMHPPPPPPPQTPIIVTPHHRIPRGSTPTGVMDSDTDDDDSYDNNNGPPPPPGLQEISQRDLNMLKAHRGNLYNFPSQVPALQHSLYMGSMGGMGGLGGMGGVLQRTPPPQLPPPPPTMPHHQ